MDCNLSYEEVKPALPDELNEVPITKYMIVTHGWLRHQSIVFQDEKSKFHILASFWQVSKGRHICKITSKVHFQQDNFFEEKFLKQQTKAKIILKASNLLAIQPFNHMFNNCRDSLRSLISYLNNKNLYQFFDECKIPNFGLQMIITEAEYNFQDELLTYCLKFQYESIIVYCGKQINLLINFKLNQPIIFCKYLILPVMQFTIGQTANPTKGSIQIYNSFGNPEKLIIFIQCQQIKSSIKLLGINKPSQHI